MATGANRLVNRHYRRATWAGPQPLADTWYTDMQRLRNSWRWRNVVPQPVAVYALKRPQLQQTEQAPGNETAADANIAISHQFDETDQHPGEENLCHSPTFKLE